MKLFSQMFFIAGLSLVLGLFFNQVRSRPLPLCCNWSVAAAQQRANEKGLLPISIYEAKSLFNHKRAIFLDARPADQYRKEHIQGALNLPWDRAEEDFVKVVQQIPEDKTIITYCDGATCDLCDKLAFFLKGLGIENVRPIDNGLSQWKKFNLPVQRSEGAGS